MVSIFLVMEWVGFKNAYTFSSSLEDTLRFWRGGGGGERWGEDHRCERQTRIRCLRKPAGAPELRSNQLGHPARAEWKVFESCIISFANLLVCYKIRSKLKFRFQQRKTSQCPAFAHQCYRFNERQSLPSDRNTRDGLLTPGTCHWFRKGREHKNSVFDLLSDCKCKSCPQWHTASLDCLPCLF